MKAQVFAILCVGAAIFAGTARAQFTQAPQPEGGRAAQLPLSGRGGQSGSVVVNQSPIPGVTTSVNTLNTSVQVQGVYTGSVRGPGLVPEGRLTLKEAIRRGLEFNLGTTGFENAVRQSRGQSRVARSALMPNVSASLRDNLQQVNLAVFGFRVPGGPGVVGPFSYFDLRATLTQTVADFTTLNNYRAAKATAEATEFSLRDARDLVVFAVSGAYLQVITAQARIASVQAQIDSAKAVYDQMAQQRAAGIVAQIDVNRSLVELQTQQQRMVSLQNDLAKQKINLARLIGLSAADTFELAHDVPFSPPPVISIDQAAKEAEGNRADLKAAETQIQAAQRALAAARAERLPSLAFSADYGVIGNNPANSHGTFTLIGSLRVPIWQGGRVQGSIEQAEAALDQRRAELDELRERIEAEIRSAFLDLASAANQVDVARNNQQLARETFRLTRERFDAGITNTVEVVQAQQSISTAELDYITSVFAHNVAKLSLARAVGRTEDNVPRFLQVP